MPRAACASPSRSTRREAIAKEMIGKTLVTKQTGPAGKQVNRLYIEDGADIARELYLSDADRPRHVAPRLRRLDRRRHGHREPSRTTRPRRSSRCRSTRDGLLRPSTAQDRRDALKLDGTSSTSARKLVGSLYGPSSRRT